MIARGPLPLATMFKLFYVKGEKGEDGAVPFRILY